MSSKLKIRVLSQWSFWLSLVLSLLCILLSAVGFQKYAVLRSATRDYIACEAAAQKLQSGSDRLTKEVRLAAATGEQRYIDAYFEEAKVTRSRETALDELSALDSGSEALEPLRQALAASMELMQTEYYSMRLVEEATQAAPALWPEEIRAVALSDEDRALSGEGKLERAQALLIAPAYEDAKDVISSDVAAALSALTDAVMERQYRAADTFAAIFRTIVICIVVFAVMSLLQCLVLRRGVVRPLIDYNESIRHGAIPSIRGVWELQTLAQTYNSVYAENEEREMLMKHQAEHDPLTGLLNRGSFDRILRLYEKDQSRFALILADVDTFKRVNDTYGHAAGDLILQRVAELFRTTFRSNDYVCRIGGDEFAIIMVDMTAERYYTIDDKISELNRRLAVPGEGLPAVSLSAGVAFSAPGVPGPSLFRAADAALYHTKEHGRCGCSLAPSADR